MKKLEREWWDESLRVPIKEEKVHHGRRKQNEFERNKIEYKERNSSVKERANRFKL